MSAAAELLWCWYVTSTVNADLNKVVVLSTIRRILPLNLT